MRDREPAPDSDVRIARTFTPSCPAWSNHASAGYLCNRRTPLAQSGRGITLSISHISLRIFLVVALVATLFTSVSQTTAQAAGELVVTGSVRQVFVTGRSEERRVGKERRPGAGR